MVVSGEHNNFVQCRIGRNADAFSTPAIAIAPGGYTQNNAAVTSYQQGTFILGSSVGPTPATNNVLMLNKTSTPFISSAGSSQDEDTQNHVYTGPGNLFTTTVGAAGGADVLPANPAQYLQIDLDGTSYRIPCYNP